MVVHERARIPKVCVKCGATKDVSRHEISFAVGHAASGAGLASGAIGAGVASVLRNTFRDEPGLMALVLAFLLVGGSLVAWVVSTRTPKIHLRVPLCEEHGARLDRARRNRTGLLVALGVASVIILAGMGAEAWLVVSLGLVLLFAAVAYALATGMRGAWVAARWAKDEHVALVVDPYTAEKIVERAAKRTAKKQREMLASAS